MNDRQKVDLDRLLGPHSKVSDGRLILTEDERLALLKEMLNSWKSDDIVRMDDEMVARLNEILINIVPKLLLSLGLIIPFSDVERTADQIRNVINLVMIIAETTYHLSTIKDETE